MQLDVTVRKGDTGKPLVIFIHGLGMDKNFWVNPHETKILAKNVPMKVFAATGPGPGFLLKSGKITIGNVPKKIGNLWTALQSHGFNLLCWSQRRPVGPMKVAVEELDEIVKQGKQLFPEQTIALVGHSRGGLIARKFMEKKTTSMKALITLSTPHGGSSLSRLGQYLSPLSALVKGLLPEDTHGAVSEVIKNVTDLIQGKALKELMPGSEFFQDLRDSPAGEVHYLSFGGKKTNLLTVYTWKREGDRICPVPLLAVPDSLVKILPASIIPDEIINNRGDFMVTTESSRLPWAERHDNVHSNHISITWNRKVIHTVLDLLGKI